MRLDELRKLAEAIRDDRARVVQSDDKSLWGDIGLVSRWTTEVTPERVLRMLAVIEAARALTAKLERGPKKEWNAFDAALAALESDQ